jgi:hypothetical protein
LIGLFFHFKRDKLDGFIVFLLFVLTGVAIIVYLNNTPYQPRERDYGYVGSFYAFAIWIGLGVYAIADLLSKKVAANIATVIAIIIGLFSAPVLMAKEGWDDHDRSDRYTARDFAANYLNSCAPNAILFTNGDNDTFPLWYAQEVEGIRTDVRVVNLSLSNTDWYIEQMRRKAYDSDPIPLTLKEEQYRQGTRDYVPVYYNPNIIKDSTADVNIKLLMDFVASEEPQAKIQTQGGMELSYLPTDKIKIPVDSATVVNNGTVPKGMESQVLKAMPWKINKQYIMKNDLMIMDIIATNNWKRPIYFAVTVGDDAYMNLEPYFQLEGLAYRLVPMRMQTNDGQTGKANTDIMYNNMMNKFKWGGMSTDGVYMDENNLRMTMNLRNNFARLAEALLAEGKTEQAKKAIALCMKEMPRKNIPYNYFMLPIAEVYYKLGMSNEANQLLKDIANIYEEDLKYYFRFKGKLADNIDPDKQQAMAVMQRIGQVARMNKQEILAKDLDERFKKLTDGYSSGM